MSYQARDAYKNTDTAVAYDSARFSSALGKARHRREWGLIEWAWNQSGLTSGAELLDVPTGTGRFLPLLAAKGAVLTGGDISQAMLDQASARCSKEGVKADFQVMDVTALPLADDSKDAVLSIRLMNHLPPDVRAQALKEFARVSRRWVFVSFSDKLSLQKVLRAPARRRSGVNQYHATLEQAKQEIETAGMRLVSHRFLLPRFSETFMCLAEVTGD